MLAQTLTNFCSKNHNLKNLLDRDDLLNTDEMRSQEATWGGKAGEQILRNLCCPYCKSEFDVERGEVIEYSGEKNNPDDCDYQVGWGGRGGIRIAHYTSISCGSSWELCEGKHKGQIVTFLIGSDPCKYSKKYPKQEGKL